jgi:copper chaperone NosL
MRPSFVALFPDLATVLVLACGPTSPRAIAYGTEPCAYCHMAIADARFSAEAITHTGRIVVFDDVGCLAAWLGQNRAPIQSAWVASFVDGEWLEASSALYLKTDSLHSPMASGMIAVRPGREADSVRAVLGGSMTSWPELLAAPPQHTPATASGS